jgi:paraquat-inducible protein B
MSKQANKSLIGAFVVGAVVLVVVGILTFGSGQFMREMKKFVLYFDGSIKGLNVGAPVNIRGVKVGEVTDIKVRFEGEDFAVRTPVFIEIDPDKFSEFSEQRAGEYLKRLRLNKMVDLLIKRGLRAQLQSQSLVTGQLLVALDFYPDKPINLVGGETGYQEMPTIPSTMEALTKTIEKLKLPLEELVDRVMDIVKGIDRVINSPELQGSISSLNQTLKSAQKLVQNIDEQIVPLSSNAKEVIEAATATLAQAEGTLSNLKKNTAETSTLRYEVDNTLRELSAAARSLHDLTDYLQRHPESLLRGKGEAERK